MLVRAGSSAAVRPARGSIPTTQGASGPIASKHYPTKSTIRRASSTGASPCTLWPASRRARSGLPGTGGPSSASSASSTTDWGRIPRTSITGTSRRETTSQRSRTGGGIWWHRRLGRPVAGVAPHPGPVLLLERVVEDPSAQRGDACGSGCARTVRAKMASKSGKLAGPRTKSVMAFAFSAVDAGGHVDEHQPRARGRDDGRPAPGWSCRPWTCRPPPGARGPGPAMTVATSSALSARFLVPLLVPSECPWPGRSMATRGRASARATVSQVWAFWAPPWSSTSSGSASPHTSELSWRPSSIATDRRSTTGGPSIGDAELLGVLVEHRELVVRVPRAGVGHRLSSSVSSWLVWSRLGPRVNDRFARPFGGSPHSTRCPAPTRLTGTGGHQILAVRSSG